MMTITETQNLIRNTQIGRLKALTRAVVAEAELAEVEKERDHWETVAIARQARGIVMAQKLDAAEAKLAHLENHIEAVAKDTHKIMFDLATQVDDPRVKALQDKAQAVVDRWDSPLWKDLRHTGTHINELRDAISALEKNK